MIAARTSITTRQQRIADAGLRAPLPPLTEGDLRPSAGPSTIHIDWYHDCLSEERLYGLNSNSSPEGDTQKLGEREDYDHQHSTVQEKFQ